MLNLSPEYRYLGGVTIRKKITLDNTSSNKTDQITLEDAFKIFVMIKRANNLSEESIGYYTNCMTFFIRFVGENTSCANIEEHTIYHYIESLQSGSLSVGSINSYLRGLRTALYFFMEKGYIQPFKFKLLKEEESIKEIYTPDEIEKLITKPDMSKCSFVDFRNYTMILHFLSTGNRIKTVLNIKVKHVDLAGGVIMLQVTKNRKAYIIPISSTYLPVLTEYMGYRKGENEDFLFCTVYGTQLSKSTLQKEIKDYNLSRGVTKSSIHLLRHTFATNWILDGGDIKRLQAILGHSTLEMVMKYVKLYGVDLRENYDQFNVLEKHKNVVDQKKKLTLHN